MNADATWYKEAVIYELRVRSFFDANGDGIGDLLGLIEKLDYLKDLGVTALWLLPLYPSPLRDDGYDIADYYGVHRSVGTLDDFRRLLDAAHARDLRVITELVLNHTSDQHPWFQRARRAPAGSVERNFYVWSSDPERYPDARIIFQDFEASNWTWDPLANAYYWHRFFHHQPDLNFDEPEVRKAMFDVVDHWFGMGVDGMRLDAVPYLYERDGTTCENLAETHGFLKELRAHVDRKFQGRMLLAEANQWPEDAVAYLGAGDECHMAFHFPIMPRLFMALRMEDSHPIADILEQTPVAPETCQWAIFLRNHDELTLEMVTEEERDYMVQRYARDRQTRINLGIRRRLAPLLENDRRRIELMNALLFALPGTPVVYYGDEIGMGDNVYLGDRDGVRTPMQWSPDRNGGFSRANPQQLILPVITDPEYSYEAINVEVQERSPSSLLWWMKRALAVRKRHPTFARGVLLMLAPENRKVLAVLRRDEAETLLVVVNLSRSPQWVELELGQYNGVRPLELFGNVEFPAIGETPYRLSIGGHDVFWFSLSGGAYPRVPEASGIGWQPPVVQLAGSDPKVLLVRGSPLERALAGYVPRQRWFRSKARRASSATLVDAVPLGERELSLVFVEIAFDEGDPEIYSLALAFDSAETAPATALLGVNSAAAAGKTLWVMDVSASPEVASALHALGARGGRLAGRHVELVGVPARAANAELVPPASARALGGEQSNSSFRLGTAYAGKLLRLVEEGPSLEVEMLEHLARAPERAHVPELVARVDADFGRSASSTVWLSQTYVQNEGDAWGLTIDAVQRFYERVLSTQRETAPELPPAGPARAGFAPPPLVVELLGDHLPIVSLLGERTAELHRALAQEMGDLRFRPRVPTALWKRSYYQSLRNLTARSFDKLARATLPPAARELVETLRARQRDLRSHLDRYFASATSGKIMRVHGDYHLGQVLYTGRDLYIVDFEGEPARVRAERERLRSPLADVAGMLRSFHYAAFGALSGEITGARTREQDRPLLMGWAAIHERWSSAAFLGAYLAAMAGTNLLPSTPATFALELEVHLLEKALYELGYELDLRPHWVELPVRGILDVLVSS